MFKLLVCVSNIQLKPGQQIPSPSELLGKILIKNKKGSHGKPAQNKKTAAAAADQTAAAATNAQAPNATSQDEANPAATTPENQDENEKPQGKFSYTPDLDVWFYFQVSLTLFLCVSPEPEATVEENEEQEDTEEQDEEKMKTSDEVNTCFTSFVPARRVQI